MSAINESWGRGSSAECNILKPCGGCFVQVRMFVNNETTIDASTRFLWQAKSDNGDVIAQGVIAGSDFQGTGWIMPDPELFSIDSAVTIEILQIAGPHYCEYIVGAVAFSDDTYYVSGYYDDCFGAPSVCFPRLDCTGDLSTCDQG
jgi:hypothetical protein